MGLAATSQCAGGGAVGEEGEMGVRLLEGLALPRALSLRSVSLASKTTEPERGSEPGGLAVFLSRPLKS